MADQIDALIAELARDHNIAVGRDDPILVLHAMNHRLLQENTVAQQALLDAYKGELDVLASRWSDDATQRASAIVRAALAGSKEAADSTVRAGAAAAAASVEAQVDAALGRFASRLQDARRIAMLNLIAACITLAAAGLVIGSRLS